MFAKLIAVVLEALVRSSDDLINYPVWFVRAAFGCGIIAFVLMVGLVVGELIFNWRSEYPLPHEPDPPRMSAPNDIVSGSPTDIPEPPVPGGPGPDLSESGDQKTQLQNIGPFEAATATQTDRSQRQ